MGEGSTGAALLAFPVANSMADGTLLTDSPPMPTTIAKRRDFLAASRARKCVTSSMIVQGRARREGEPHAANLVRVGYTCSKKVGNAVARNRAKRRLRAAVAATLPRLGRPGWDYVLIGRNGATADRLFTDLIHDLETAITKLHAPKPPRPAQAPR